MHRYLRSIGFSKYRNEDDVEKLLESLVAGCGKQARILRLPNDDLYWEVHAEVGSGMGLVLSGVVNRDGMYKLQRYFPYIESPDNSSTVECTIQRHVDDSLYSGLLDDTRVGITLIFRLMNAADYLELSQQMSGGKQPAVGAVRLAAFCDNGTIIMPLKKTAKQREMTRVANENRDLLIEAARKGDETAMESLTNEDMSLYSSISKRMMKEDIYSIIDSCFMPQGIECDIYQIVGDIVSVDQRTNTISGEKVWDFLLNCSDLPFHVAINEADLLGEPRPGRRFKGTIWMQGRAMFLPS